MGSARGLGNFSQFRTLFNNLWLKRLINIQKLINRKGFFPIKRKNMNQPDQPKTVHFIMQSFKINENLRFLWLNTAHEFSEPVGSIVSLAFIHTLENVVLMAMERPLKTTSTLKTLINSNYITIFTNFQRYFYHSSDFYSKRRPKAP